MADTRRYTQVHTDTHRDAHRDTHLDTHIDTQHRTLLKQIGHSKIGLLVEHSLGNNIRNLMHLLGEVSRANLLFKPVGELSYAE